MAIRPWHNEEEEHHALDHRRRAHDSVAARTRDVVHDGRFHPHPAGRRHHRHPGPRPAGPPTRLTDAGTRTVRVPPWSSRVFTARTTCAPPPSPPRGGAGWAPHLHPWRNPQPSRDGTPRGFLGPFV